MAPALLAVIAWQPWCWKGRRPVYGIGVSFSNAALALLRQAADAVA